MKLSSLVLVLSLSSCVSAGLERDLSVLETKLEAIGDRVNRGELTVQEAREEVRKATLEAGSPALDPLLGGGTLVALLLSTYGAYKGRKNGNGSR